MADRPSAAAFARNTDSGAPARLALGLMSGTSLDGIDAALIRTDGRTLVEPGPCLTEPYDPAFRRRLRAILGGRGDIAPVERELTLRHADLVRRLLADAGRRPGEIAVIGFHGHTILHAPAARRTWQIGDGALLAAETGIDVVSDLRSQDVAAGGEGAPLVPLYHAARAAGLSGPLAVLNLGGVANVTFLDHEAEAAVRDGGPASATDRILAFDTGPGNALIDDWMLERGDGATMDSGGALARAGRVDRERLARLLDNPYFARPVPKSLDRDAFDVAALADLSPADGAATLTAFTVEAVARAREHMPRSPRRWLVTGGGRHNLWLMESLATALGVRVEPVEAVGWNGDALEAEAFAYLAVRSLDGLPLSLPGTTGVPRPMTGGRLAPRPRAA